MKKLRSFLLNLFFWSFTTFFGLICLTLAFLQTDYAKDKLRSLLQEQLQKYDSSAFLGVIEGNLPLQVEIKHLLFATDQYEVSLSNLHVRIALRSLVAKKLIISRIAIKEASFRTFSKNSEITDLSGLITPLKGCFSIDSFTIDKLHLPEHSLHVDGQGHIGGMLLDSQLTLKIHTQEETPSFLEIEYRADHKEFSLECYAKITEHLSLQHGKVNLDLSNSQWEMQAKGQKETLVALVRGNHSTRTDTLFPPIKASVTMSSQTITGLEAYHIYAPFNCMAKAQVFASSALNISDLQINTPHVTGSISGSLDKSRRILGGRFQLKANDLAKVKLPQAGLALADNGVFTGNFDGKKTKVEFFLDELSLHSVIYKKLKGTLIAETQGLQYSGAFNLKATHSMFPFDLACKFTQLPPDDLQIQDLVIHGPSTDLGGELTLNLQNWDCNGFIVGRIENLQKFQELFPSLYLNGSLACELKLSTDTKQNVEIHALLEDFFAGKLYVQNGSFDGSFYDVKDHITGEATFDIHQGKYGDFDLKSGKIHTYWDSGRWPYEISLQGFWKHPFELESSGSWMWVQQSFDLKIDELFGYTLKKPFRLVHKTSLKTSPTLFSLDDFIFDIGKGRLASRAHLSAKQSEIKLEGAGLPLDLIAVIYPDFSFNGMSSIDAHFTEYEGRTQGNAHIYLDHAELLHLGRTEPSKAKGLLCLNYDRDTLQTHLLLRSEHEQFLELTGTYPLEISLFPLRATLDDKRNFYTELTAEGFLQEIFDFIEPGFQRIEGFLSTRILASGKLSEPSLHGELDLQNGLYENYFIGADIRNINAKAYASGQEILFDSITASDGKTGKISGSGHFSLNNSEHFPYQINLDLQDAKALGLDMVEAWASGRLMLSGNQRKMLISGNLDLDKTIFTVSDTLPTDIPVIPIDFINLPPSLENTRTKQALPVQIDLNLNTKENTLVRGKGLKSYWGGKIHVSGVNLNLSAEGQLSLAKGEFLFAGKTFSLTHGEISFSDKPQNPAHINLTGILNLKAATIIATLRGPLTAPVLTFTSNPPMPTSEIVSYILFDKPSSEVKPIEAIQLAQTIVSLSGGGGPDILDAIRKKLGVDKLTIVSGKDSSDQISVQIGRYVTKGVMVTLSQSPNKSDVIVEIDLSHGFTFQAETQDQEEGKFTLKWNCNY